MGHQPLTDDVVRLLVLQQQCQPEGYPYVFVPPRRYEAIQELRINGKWSYSSSRLSVVNNFGRQFSKILKRASVKRGTFHDIRRTALSRWLTSGLSEHDVMSLAGHASFNTTHQFYLAVADDLVDRARRISDQVLSQKVVRFGALDDLDPKEKRQAAITTCLENS